MLLQVQKLSRVLTNAPASESKDAGRPMEKDTQRLSSLGLAVSCIGTWAGVHLASVAYREPSSCSAILSLIAASTCLAR